MRTILLVLLLLAGARTLAAQDTTAVADTTVERFPPGKAFLRSMIVPGWGQFSVGAWTRGTLFAALQGTSYYMLFKTNSRLNKAEERLDDRTTLVRDSLVALDDTVNLENRIEDLTAPQRSLVSSRERHLQDWITYTIFFTLASGVDAFVAAHLADFPARIGTERQADGALQLKVSVPLPSRRQH